VASYSCSLLPRPPWLKLLVRAAGLPLTPPPPLPGGPPGGGAGGFADGCLGFAFCGGGGGGATVGLLGCPPPPEGRAAAGFDVGGGGGGGPAFRIELVEEDGLALGVNDGVELRLDDEYELVRLEFEVEFWRLPLPKLADLGPVELK